MPEIYTQKLIPMEVKYGCDACKEKYEKAEVKPKNPTIGEMQFTGFVKQGEKGGFEHKCAVCGAMLLLPNQYPVIRYVTEAQLEQLEPKVPEESKTETEYPKEQK